jgi:hypothetical protein
LEDVFSLFEIPEAWDQKVGDGVNGVLSANRDRFFRNEVEAVDAYLPGVFLEQNCGLASGVDYGGTRIADYADGTLPSLGEPDMEGEDATLIPWLAPMVFLARPGSDPESWCRGEKLGDVDSVELGYDDAKFSVSAQVPAKTRKVRFKVSGGPQHSIAAGESATNDGDNDTDQVVSYATNFLVTLAAKSGIRLLSEVPVAPEADREIIRRLVIDSGLPYHVVTVANHTVVDVDSDGNLVRSTGGIFCRPYDAKDRLNAIAQIAYEWYSVPHQSISLETTCLLGDDKINVGDLIHQIGDTTDSNNTHVREINSVVTEIRVEWPTVMGDTPPAPTMRIQTQAAELDPLALGAVFAAGGGRAISRKAER